MPIITALKPQKSRKRVNVYLDGKFSFGIDLENFLKLGLKVEKELSEKEIKEIVKKAEFKKTCDKLIRFTTLRPRSKREINNWLRKYKVHESIHKELFSKLKRLELVNDEKFAVWWVEQRTSFRPRGKRALEAELRQKGIDRKFIIKALNKVKIDEVKIARELLKKKKYRWERLDKSKAREKMTGFLARKGFDWDVIKKVIKD